MTLVRMHLPAFVLGLAALGLVVAAVSMQADEGAREWYRSTLGGSALFKINALFALTMPFLAGGAVALAVLHRARRREAEAHTPDSLKRHEVNEVATHWLNAAGIGLGLVTAAWLLGWIGNPLSLEVTYVLHMMGAGLTLGAVSYHLAYQWTGGGRGLIPTSGRDVRNALAESVSYTGIYRGLRGAFGIQLPRPVRQPFGRVLRRLHIVPDRSGKYLATERVLSYPIWAVLVGLIVVTGVVKSLHYVYPLPTALREAMTFLHDGATIFLVIFLVFHVGALVLVPRNWPLLKSMFTTRISRRYAEQHLPLWVEEIDAVTPRPEGAEERDTAARPARPTT